MGEVWFWQLIVSPHMVGLASSLAGQGWKVTYVAEKELTTDRVKLGWKLSKMPGVQLRVVADRTARLALVDEASPESIHLCQGIRGNRPISYIQRELAKRGFRQWAVMETVDDFGPRGAIKRWEYSRQIRKKGRFLNRILAIGHSTKEWLIARGMAAGQVSPFTYFLPDLASPDISGGSRPSGPFRLLFVGQFIPLKRLDLLIQTLHTMRGQEFELWVAGAGPKEKQLRELAESALPGQVRWLGGPQADVLGIMRQVDCLVLPSRHDGWGAVVSEALMTGTPVVCSDACGAAGVVMASGFGGTFPRDQGEVLRSRLEKLLADGPISMDQRIKLATWATCLGAEAGARYLIELLDYEIRGGKHPLAPWES